MSFEATKQFLTTQKAADIAGLPAIIGNIEDAQNNAAYWTAKKDKVEARIAEADGAIALLDGAFD